MTQTATMTQEPQRMRALERANEVRLKRAELKRQIADGYLSAADIILDLPDEATNWSVGELLKSQRRWGSIRSHKLLVGLHISEKRPIGELTLRQRRLLAERLAEHVSRHLAEREMREVHALVTPDVEVQEAPAVEAPQTTDVEVPERSDVEIREYELVGA
jgi:hypothetical protein